MKRVLSLILTVIMLMMLIPTAALAADDLASGSFTGNGAITWRISSDGTLYIDGKGDMPYEKPWMDLNDQVKSVKVGEGITLVLCLGGPNVNSVSLPDGLTAIGSQCFAECKMLKSLTIPDSVETIANMAFAGCTSLATVNMPKSLTSVGPSAFGGCEALKTVSFGSKLETIGNAAFAGCSKLETVSLPKSLSGIGAQAFDNCPALTKVSYAGSSSDWSKVSTDDNTRALLSKKLVFNSATPEINVTAGNNASTGKVTLSWNSVKNAAKYEIWRATSKNGSFTKQYTTTKTSYTNSTSNAGKTYYYKVKALDLNGKVIVESTVVSRLCAYAVPVVTSGNAAKSGKVTLSWTAIDGAAKYEIWRATSKTGSFKKQYTTTKTSYTNSGAVAGKTYYYIVKAVDSDGNVLSESKSVSRTCDCAAPVISSSVIASSGKIQLKWEPVDGAVKYEIYRATGKNGTYKLQYTTTKTKYTNTNSTAGYTYYYKVKAIGTSSYSDSAFSNVTYRTCDCAMMNAQFDCNEKGNVVFTWDKVSGATSYKVYRAGSSKGTYKLLGETKSTSFTDTTANVGYYYYYKLVAVSSRSSAADSAPLMGVAFPAPAQPKNLKVTDNTSSKKLTFSWSKVSGADGYILLIGTSSVFEKMYVLSELEENTLKKSYDYSQLFSALNNPTVYIRVMAYTELSTGDVVFSKPSASLKVNIPIGALAS